MFDFKFDLEAKEVAALVPWPNTRDEWSTKQKNTWLFFSLLENHSNWISPLFAHLTLQLQWNVYPICHLPAPLHGKPISDLNDTVLVECIDIDSNDVYDIAGISENILLMQGNGFWLHFPKHHIHTIQCDSLKRKRRFRFFFTSSWR